MANQKGIDVSHWTYPTNWTHWMDLGFIFAYIKTTEGYPSTWVDSQWKNHYAESNGFYRGAYHYFRVQTNGAEQAQHFYNTAKDYEWDMKPVIDVEKYNNEGYSQSVFAARLRNCLYETERLFGIRPMIYTSRHMWHQMVGSVSWASAYDLWVAHYTTYPVPLIPDDWKGAGWKMWQYIDRPRDQNRFDGNLEEFLAWMGKDVPPPEYEILPPGLYKVE